MFKIKVSKFIYSKNKDINYNIDKLYNAGFSAEEIDFVCDNKVDLDFINKRIVYRKKFDIAYTIFVYIVFVLNISIYIVLFYLAYSNLSNIGGIDLCIKK